ncbi:MAG: AAA family ATPase [Verrucomicrobiota bacterium]
MTMYSFSDGNEWAVREAIVNLMELVDTVASVATENIKILRDDAQNTVRMLTAAIILSDGKYDAAEKVFIRHLALFSEKPSEEMNFLNEYAEVWSAKSKEIPSFFHAAIQRNTDTARLMLCELQRIGDYVSISDGKFQTSERKIVAKYIEFLEDAVIARESGQLSLASVDSSSEESENGSRVKERPAPPPPITRPQFNLVLTFANNVLKMINTLESDKAMLESVENFENKGTTDSGTIIRQCVLFDLARIFKILLGDNIDARLVEMSSLAFVSNYIRGDFTIKSMDYEVFVDLYEQGTWTEEAKTLLNSAAASSYPISISIQKGDEPPLVRKPDFVLPALLSKSGNPLFDKYAVTLCQFATVIAKADGVVSGNEEVLLKQIYEMVHNPIPEIAKNTAKVSKSPDNQSLKEVMDELDLLVGLVSVKQEVMTLINFASIQIKREELGLKSSQVSYHLVLTGSPGTGKTTVARIVSKIYNLLGILEKGQLVETDRSGLIAEYTGQTPGKVNRAVDSALDGVLFIDEAYALVEGSNENYGKEALATLIKRMEDDRGRLVVMVAGYTEEMKTFINANSGLKSRFNKYIEFPDYVPDEMLEIFVLQCKALDYSLTDEARTKALNLFKVAYEQRDRSFGNGRYVRNMFEKSMELQANRVSSLTSLTKEILTSIVDTDIPE